MPNTLSRGHVPATPGTLCQFDYYGRKCQHNDGQPGPAVHKITQSLPVAPAGTELCAYHSPYDVLRRWELTLSPDSPKGGRDVHTFTWGRTRREAYARVTDMMDADGGMWDGWSFTLANDPTPNVYA